MTNKPTIRMPKDTLTKWLTALRSGEYKQGVRRLQCGEGPDARFCCLGVLQHVVSGSIVPDDTDDLPRLDWLLANGISFTNYAGDDALSPFLPTEGQSAHGLNDSGVSFAVIADAIEASTETY
jgi:hypothetical protein